MDWLKAFDIGQTFKATMVLFAVIDIVGSIPIILKLKQSTGTIESTKVSLVSLGIMVGFLIVGGKHPLPFWSRDRKFRSCGFRHFIRNGA